MEVSNCPKNGAANAIRVCGKCGSKIFADAPQGFCSLCLFTTGLGSLNEEDDVLESSAGRIDLNFDDYELLKEIGRGGQGVVYRARQKSLNRTVALKVIRAGQWATEAHLKRFRLEAEAAASLDHPYIVPIHEIRERPDCCYFSMNLVEGGQLDEAVKRQAISIRRTAELIAKLARTVHYAHEHGILHRDIKPGNILLDAEGEPHLTDFGLARLVESENHVTRTTDMLGTPSYMAPEQARGGDEALTTTTDIYGLGAVLYQLLTGHPPFVGATSYETVRLLLETEPRSPRLLNPKVDRDLSTICLKCLEKDPQRRYPTAQAVAEDLEHWLRREPIRARRTALFTRGKKWLQRNPTMAVAAASMVGLIVAVAFIVWKVELLHPPRGARIAVLPFEDLSEDRTNAYFADGVQDDILTRLAKVADLKVISRTSVMQYRGARDTQQIGRALNVSHILEGSVRRETGRIRLNAQLINVRNDTHVWAEAYDRDLEAVFAIQSEIAQKVAEQLHAKISPQEKVALERPTTSDLAAFDLYAHARELSSGGFSRVTGTADFFEAINLLNQAVARDPAFFAAYCQIARTHSQIYLLGHDHTPARLALAEAAIQAALRLRPEGGEAHLARAEMLYRGHLDYAGALAELDIAQQSLPNDSHVFELRGYVQRRQGNYEEGVRNLERANDLDPRNVFLLQQLALGYFYLRRYAEQESVYDRVLAIDPDNVEAKLARAEVQFLWKANIRPFREAIESLQKSNPGMVRDLAPNSFSCALIERDLAAARSALIAAGDNTFINRDTIHFSRSLAEGIVARLAGDETAARRAFMAARAEQEKTVHAQPDYAPPLCILALIDAALGRKDEALLEGRRATELLPPARDAINGPLMIEYFAVTAAWVGEKDLACEQLETLLRYPSSINYGELKLSPFWDPLRGYPRFEKIVASLSPEE